LEEVRVMNAKVWMVGRAVRVAGHVLADKVTRPVARNPGEVPRDGLAISVEWLTDVVCRQHPDARVVSFHSPHGDSGTSTRAALRLEYNDAGERAGLPTELFTKTTRSFSQRMLLGGAKVLDGETRFFMGLRPKLDIEAPRGYWGGFDQRSWRSFVLMEDIAATKGARFIEPTTPLTREQVADLVQNMARFHGQLWEDDAIRVLKTPRDHFRNVKSFIDMEARAKVGMERAKDVIPSALYGLADRLWKGTERSLELASTGMPRTLLHGDSHVGQTYITGEGRMGLTDWQACQQGGWAYDFAYLVGSACEPEDRREWERDLLELYLEQVAKAGGTAPSFDDAWLAYRQQLFYPYSAWAFTIGRAAYQPKMQPKDTCRVIIKRLSTAIDDLDSLGAIGV
jgi:hypothetical protein